MGKGKERPLDPNDPRNLNHPSQDEAWREFARAVGRWVAQRELKRRGMGKDNEHRTNNEGRDV
jgi:hypothetical protein